MTRVPKLLPIVALALASCHRGANTDITPQEVRPLLASFTPQRIVLVPTARVIFAASDSLIVRTGSGPAAGKYFDDELLRRLHERGVANDWIVPADLMRAYERNRTYAQDPYHLATDPVRLPNFAAGSKYGEPLSTQLRTMIALHNDARFVLLPIDLRLHQAGRTTLKLALLDPRKAESLWVGQVMSDSTPAQSTASVGQLARRVADLFAAP